MPQVIDYSNPLGGESGGYATKEVADAPVAPAGGGWDRPYDPQNSGAGYTYYDKSGTALGRFTGNAWVHNNTLTPEMMQSLVGSNTGPYGNSPQTLGWNNFTDQSYMNDLAMKGADKGSAFSALMGSPFAMIPLAFAGAAGLMPSAGDLWSSVTGSAPVAAEAPLQVAQANLGYSIPGGTATDAYGNALMQSNLPQTFGGGVAGAAAGGTTLYPELGAAGAAMSGLATPPTPTPPSGSSPGTTAALPGLLDKAAAALPGAATSAGVGLATRGLTGGFSATTPSSGGVDNATMGTAASDYWSGGSGGISGLLSTLAGGLGSLPAGSVINGLMSGASGLYGLSLADQLKKQAAAAQQQTLQTQQQAMAAAAAGDPWGTSGARAEAAGKLRTLMNDPSGVTKLPGYDAGLQAVQRTMASQGYLGSGNMMTALSKYGGDFYNQALQQLSGLAGAGQNPQGVTSAILGGGNLGLSGAGTALQGAGTSASLASQSLASLGYGVNTALGNQTMLSPQTLAMLKAAGILKP